MIAFLPLEHLNVRPPRVLGFRGRLMIAFLPLEHVSARPPRVFGFRGFGVDSLGLKIWPLVDCGIFINT